MTVEPFYVQKKGEVEVKISFGLPPSCHWTPEAPSNWQILPEGKSHLNKNIWSMLLVWKTTS